MLKECQKEIIVTQKNLEIKIINKTYVCIHSFGISMLYLDILL